MALARYWDAVVRVQQINVVRVMALMVNVMVGMCQIIDTGLLSYSSPNNPFHHDFIMKQ
jgi:hypothetical protein